VRCVVEVNRVIIRTTTMANEGAVSDIVTEFLLNICQLRPPQTDHVAHAVGMCAVLATLQPSDDAEAQLIPLLTGSVAEFYIDPILPHFGDVDVMFHVSNQLAVPRGQLPPTQLPAEFHTYVKVYEIVQTVTCLAMCT